MDFDDNDFFLDGDADVAVAEAHVQAAIDRSAEIISAATAGGSRRQAKCTTPIYWDLETTPDYDRLPSFSLTPVPPIPEPTAFDQLPPAEGFLAGTADVIKLKLVKIGVADDRWLEVLTATEEAGKNRKGVLDDIRKAGLFRKSAEQAHEDRIKLLSTTPEYCRICALGVAIGNDEVKSFVVGEPWPLDRDQSPDRLITERDIIEAFWSRVAECSPLVGYNIAAFDLPVLLTRSALLDIEPTRRIDLKPWSNDVLDLYIARFGSRGNTDRQRPGTLKKLAAAFGIEIPVEDCDGSQVSWLMDTEEGKQKVGCYVRSDVHILRELHRKLSGYFWT
jgi:hypothetical protein